MALLNTNEIESLRLRLGLTKISKWRLEEFNEIIGYLGDQLKLVIEGEKDGMETEVQVFLKCMPRFDKWKSEFLIEAKFFDKEYIMLNDLFEKFLNEEGPKKWRPMTLYMREDLFVFEDVSKLGYEMPQFKETMSYEALKATVKTIARFHAQSYIYEEKRSKELGRLYKIWDEYSEYLQEPVMSNIWRDTGRNAVIGYLKAFSKHKSYPNFSTKLDEVIPKLFEKTLDLMKPNNKYRNVVVHRDLWSNNIFIKNDGISEPQVLLVDFQTVLYTSPMLDLSSFIYFNTTKAKRDSYSLELIEHYYNTLSDILEESGLNVNKVLPKDNLLEAYADSLLFALTQASLIVPYTTISNKWKKKLFSDPVKSEKVNLVSRSDEYLEIANEDPVYQERVTELLDEIVERYICPDYEQNGSGHEINENV